MSSTSLKREGRTSHKNGGGVGYRPGKEMTNEWGELDKEGEREKNESCGFTTLFLG